MTTSSLQLSRLRVMWRGKAVYDQLFHQGVNIIRGLNSSGKSTIADFIFYALGGELESWKGAAQRCEEVQAEVKAQNATLTIRRPIGTKLTQPSIFYGSMDDASRHGLDSWSGHPLHRTGSQESFSQILFRAAGIPEAPGAGDSNLTMHQLLRLMYSDQRTPAGKLFRFETFDTGDIREAVGELLCGTNVYEAYSIRLRLRELDKLFKEKEQELSLKLAAMPRELTAVQLEDLEFQIQRLTNERATLVQEIANVDSLIPPNADKTFLEERQSAAKRVSTKARKIRSIEAALEKLDYEIADIERYITFLDELLRKLSNAEDSSAIVGPIEFTHCPACLAELTANSSADRCVVCGAPKSSDAEHNHYLQIRIDFQIQLRESHQLRDAKRRELGEAEAEHRRQRREYGTLLSEFGTRYEVSSSPRESFLAERNQRLGRLEREIGYFQSLVEVAAAISKLTEEKAAINEEIGSLQTRLSALTRSAEARRRQALTLMSSIGCDLLSRDLPRQEEFLHPNSLLLSFRDDAISLDGNMNFSESSNVILKNTAILSLLSAATKDGAFYHPRFLLLDNVEDKGMEEVRSHNYQKLIVSISEAASTAQHQIIFTTSMMNPELESEKYVIGPAYTRERRTLDLPGES